MNLRLLWTILKVMIGLTLLGLLIWKTDVSAILDAVRAADPAWCLAGAVGFLGLSAFEIARLHGLLHRYPLRFWPAARIYLISKFYGNFVPGSLGAEVYKVIALRRMTGQTTRVVAHLVVIRFTALLLSLLIAVALLPWSWPRFQHGVVSVTEDLQINWTQCAFIIGGAVLVLTTAFLTPPAATLRRWVRVRCGYVRDAWKEVGRLDVVVLVCWSIAALSSRVIGVWAFARATGMDIRLEDVAVIIAAVNVASMIPISFAALGVREGVLAFLLVSLGGETGAAVAVGLLSRAVMWFVSLLGGALVIAGAGRTARDAAVGGATHG